MFVLRVCVCMRERERESVKLPAESSSENTCGYVDILTCVHVDLDVASLD